jgi:ABC transport system ATP-binding/permease protein
VWKEYVGGYSDWQRMSKAGRAEAREEEKRAGKKADARPPKKPAKAKLNYKESRELAELPGRIEALEKEQAALAAELSDGSLYATRPEEAMRVQKRVAEIDEALTAALTRWEALDARS